MDRRQFIQVAGVGSLAMMLTPLAQAADAAAATQARLADHVSEKELTRIVWGSCCHQDKPQPIWDPLNDFKPDLFIMLGDNIYADTTDMTVMAHKYQMLGNQPGFKRVRAHCPVVAIWDDHDYGVNDGGAEYPMRNQSKQIMLDFFEEPADSPRRARAGNYVSYLFGPAGRRVQVILPDSRYFRSPIKSSAEPRGKDVRGEYTATYDPSQTMLGEEQWQWLAQQLQQPADLRIFGMGTQFLAEFNGYEAWANFPLERERLLTMLREYKVEHAFFISGDTHWAELSRVHLNYLYPLYDMTSSGLTEVWNNVGPNLHRLGRSYLGQNFGSIEIDWQSSQPAITLQIHDVTGKVQLERKIPLKELEFGNAVSHQDQTTTGASNSAWFAK
jgi:alkaline phosphatase D